MSWLKTILWAPLTGGREWIRHDGASSNVWYMPHELAAAAEEQV